MRRFMEGNENIYACYNECNNDVVCFAFWMDSELNCLLWIRDPYVRGVYLDSPLYVNQEMTALERCYVKGIKPQYYNEPGKCQMQGQPLVN